ncbi:CoA transferase [Acuticoccus sediminis]|uniref:CoA transferase n=1 Tax=Acuticoccus sediminis TaxID=2184697 RepID=A0A8B2NQJ9_9HYPH|nr:CoA transferase [Acuticoccus sediminis]RAH99283.1 CoA transferase [Acuticoccus sediminis]
MKDMLGGVRIVDVTTIVMGPMASQILADLGADVVKVEPPEGDLARYSGTPGPDGISSIFASNNRNKRSIALDLRRPDGQEVLQRLIEGGDVVLHNMRPKAAERLGLSAEAVRRIKPSIVHCVAVGFGSGGPYAGTAAYDDVIQAASGLAALPLKVGRQPDYVPSIMADKVAALHIVYAVLAALMRRARTGEGCAIEVPMFEALAAFILNEHLGAATFEAGGKPGYQRLLSPHRRPFATADGWISALPYTEAQWRRTLAEIGRMDVTEAPWFATAPGRNANTATLYQILGAALATRTTAQCLAMFEALDVPHARVNTLDDLIDDPHLAATGFFRPTDDLEGRARSVPQPVAFHGVEDRPDRAPPALAADGATVLEELGYSKAQVARMRADGTIL